MNESPFSNNFSGLAEGKQQAQVATWGLLFLIGDLALTIRSLRDKLHAKGILAPEDENAINQVCVLPERLAQVYSHIDKAFQEKCNRILYAITHPEDTAKAFNSLMDQEEPEKPKEEKIISDDIKSTAWDESKVGGPDAQSPYRYE